MWFLVWFHRRIQIFPPNMNEGLSAYYYFLRIHLQRKPVKRFIQANTAVKASASLPLLPHVRKRSLTALEGLQRAVRIAGGGQLSVESTAESSDLSWEWQLCQQIHDDSGKASIRVEIRVKYRYGHPPASRIGNEGGHNGQ